MVEITVIYHWNCGTRDQTDNSQIVELTPDITLGLRMLFHTMEAAAAEQTEEGTEEKHVNYNVVNTRS